MGDFRISVIFGERNPFSGRVDGLSVAEPGKMWYESCCQCCWLGSWVWCLRVSKELYDPSTSILLLRFSTLCPFEEHA